jgi:hypothetical protein
MKYAECISHEEDSRVEGENSNVRRRMRDDGWWRVWSFPQLARVGFTLTVTFRERPKVSEEGECCWFKSKLNLYLCKPLCGLEFCVLFCQADSVHFYFLITMRQALLLT